jgi:hypothetical protein
MVKPGIAIIRAGIPYIAILKFARPGVKKDRLITDVIGLPELKSDDADRLRLKLVPPVDVRHMV